MKEFFKTRSYDMVRMFLNQFATGIFGMVLAMAATRAQNVILRNITSVFAILFYLFLLYTMTWEIGFKDKVSMESGRKKRAPLTGFWISLCANIPNFLFALFIMLAWILGHNNVEIGFFSTLGGISTFAALSLEGMYTGLLAGLPWVLAKMHLNDVTIEIIRFCVMYFVITIPALVTCAVSYYLGLRDIKFTSYFNVQYPASDREPKQKKRK